jgi:hypothetical protein
MSTSYSALSVLVVLLLPAAINACSSDRDAKNVTTSVVMPKGTPSVISPASAEPVSVPEVQGKDQDASDGGSIGFP